MRRINRLARALKAKGDRRRIDQIRADILLDLLTGKGQPNGSSEKGVVEIRVDMTTLAGIDDDPAEIPGFGPVLADVARKIVDEASDSEWRIIPVDENGQPVGVVTTKKTTHHGSETDRGDPESDLCLPRMPHARRRM